MAAYCRICARRDGRWDRTESEINFHAITNRRRLFMVPLRQNESGQAFMFRVSCQACLYHIFTPSLIIQVSCQLVQIYCQTISAFIYIQHHFKLHFDIPGMWSCLLPFVSCCVVFFFLIGFLVLFCTIVYTTVDLTMIVNWMFPSYSDIMKVHLPKLYYYNTIHHFRMCPPTSVKSEM